MMTQVIEFVCDLCQKKVNFIDNNHAKSCGWVIVDLSTAETVNQKCVCIKCVNSIIKDKDSK